jgi:hypothetical protein
VESVLPACPSASAYSKSLESEQQLVDSEVVGLVPEESPALVPAACPENLHPCLSTS